MLVEVPDDAVARLKQATKDMRVRDNAKISFWEAAGQAESASIEIIDAVLAASKD